MRPDEIAAIEDPEIRAAQLRLETRRKQEGIEPQTAESAQRGALFLARRRARSEQTLADVLAMCVTSVSQVAPETHAQRADRIAEARNDAGIPDAFACCPRGCPWSAVARRCACGERLVPMSWALLATLRGPENRPALGGVRVGGKLLRGAAAVAELQRQMTAPKVLLIGDTRAGKSVSAAAFLGAQCETGAARARWSSAASLSEPGAADRAAGAKLLVLDDLGEELFAASEGTGLAAQRCVPAAELLGELARLRGRRLVVTTYLRHSRRTAADPPGVAELYGGGVAARLFEGATVVELGR